MKKRVYRALQQQGRYRPVVIISSSLKKLREYINSHPRTYYVTSREYESLSREWARTGGQPSSYVVLD